jgi:hypothetical protein
MTSAETRSIAQALVHADHRYLAIRPADATPTEAPAAMMGDATFPAFQAALQNAGEFWKDCTTWALIGSDEQIASDLAGWPPGVQALRMPVVLTTFTTD